MRCAIMIGIPFFTVGLAAAAGPVEAGKLLGAWELTKVEGQDTVPHWRLEFLKDGKLRMSAQKGGEELRVEGTYTLVKDRLTFTARAEGKAVDTQTVTVRKLTGDVLVILDRNKRMEFKRVK